MKTCGMNYKVMELGGNRYELCDGILTVSGVNNYVLTKKAHVDCALNQLKASARYYGVKFTP